MSKRILIKCNEATSICDKTQYGEASRFDKIRLLLHNFLCHRCKLYSEQNKLMTKIFKVNKEKCTEHKLCTSDKEAMQDALDKEITS
ncbi:MAG: hypothetical protein V3U80_06670 [Flavobacteriaceae bacterium]